MKRSSAADALLWAPDQQRLSLTVLVNHTVDKVHLDHRLKAHGVRFSPTASRNANHQYNVKAAKSVILAAGTLATAPILERSGVGGAGILSAAKVKQMVDLPGVGANLNDQPGSATSALVKKGYQNDTSVIDGRQLFGPEISLVNIDNIWPADVRRLPPVPVAEFIAESDPSVLSAPFWPLMPLSRGHIHISSANPFDYPVITPRFLTDMFDQQVAIAVARRSRELWNSAPLADLVADAYYVPPTIGPNGSDADYLKWLQNSSGGAGHWLGATAMMPRELGGVVDARLRVYGTKNLRIVDAGILPFQITSHMMSTMYAVAQRGAELILQDCE
ncbi:hypothetical protein E4U53_003532 [Claviceps sorghi]|nr:hypothetical protein E4U53_003532 [Claviceps sorghi]